MNRGYQNFQKALKRNLGKGLFSFVRILGLIIFIFCAVNALEAQSLGGLDLKSVKVDELSDEQILSYMKQAEERGLTQSELELLARQRGVSESEISKLRRRVEALRSGVNTMNNTSTDKRNSRLEPSLLNDESVFGALSSDEAIELTEEQKKIFGFDLFQKRNLTFAPNLNLPTPVDYQLGPKDVLVVDLWGVTQAYFQFEVSPEGTIRPENLSPVYVNGLTIEAASKKIIDRLSQIYSGLKAQGNNPPTIFHQISLGNIRTINIEVVGEVAKPSMYSLPSLSTVYTALHAAGGPTENGTFRKIRVVRNNKLLSTLDVYPYLTSGIRSGDVRLKNGDVIIVEPFSSRIELDGEIKRSGLFELKDNESFSDLLSYAGGFTSKAFKSTVTVKRNGNREREIIDVDQERFDDFQPSDGDLIEVSGILDRFSNRVIISGAIYREGEYQLTSELTLKKLIEKAGGVRGDANMSRITIYRTGDNFSQSVIPVDLAALLRGDIVDITLSREDVVQITSIYDLKEEYYVQVSGEVIEGGVYPFFNGMTVQDLIILSGGLKESASGAMIEIARRNTNGGVNSAADIITLSIDQTLSLDSEDRNQILKPFDQVYIRKSPGYTIQQQVTVEGEALATGVYTISRKDERISDVIKRAGGLTPYADASGAILIRKTEFSNSKSNDQISQESLQQLRQKVLKDESELKNVSQTQLIERLKKLEDKVETDTQNDLVGSKLKKELIQDISEQDSLVRNIEIKEEEPVAINLQRILDEPGSKYDLIVKEGDVISIPGKLETVRVAGEVTSPLNVRFDKEFSFKDYIERSGGFLITAKKGGSYIQYPNGERRQVKRFLFFKKYPKVEAGSTIFVSRKPDRKPVNVQAIISAFGTVATIALVIDRLSN
ncbi:protein involved in polysaccharide export with SLBB domain [Roseivirga ehrenbergii]|nr:protein involved in polysaccharide export with SLBB domain [Roseivirga ehrenbergii]